MKLLRYETKEVNLTLFCFLIIQLVIYILSQFYDGDYIDYINYISIILSFIMSIYIALKVKPKNYLYISLGLLFTVIADFFLVILMDYLSIALVFFIIVQLLYYQYATYNITNKVLFKTIIITSLILILLHLIILNKYLPLLYTLVVIYISIFILNIILSIKYLKNYIFITGLISFILCDICVGIDFLLTENDIPIYFFFNLIWIFYIPAQVLISINGLYHINTH